MIVNSCIITYNQEEFIAQTIEGALFQRLNHEHQIIISDDNSTDQTFRICKEYADRYPNKIKLLRTPHNLGMLGNWQFAIQSCDAKYIAICEGDDYWTDPNKLQKQVDFLEQNSDYAICHHAFDTFYEADRLLDKKIDIHNQIPESYDIEFLSKGNSIGTLSVMFRNIKNKFPENFEKFSYADYALHLWNSNDGKIKFFKEYMAVYRRHKKSITGDHKGVDGSLVLIKYIREILDNNIVKHLNAGDNLKVQLVNSYLTLLAHFHHEMDRPSFLRYFKELQLYKEAYNTEGIDIEKLIKYYITHIRWSFENREVFEREKILIDFDSIQVQFLLNETILLLKENTSMKSSRTFVLGNKIKRILSSILS